MKILAHTADITEHNIEKCKKSGFDVILNKPLSKDQI